MSEQDKRAISICEAMENIPRATSPRTPLVWAYEVKAQRDELLAALKELHALADDRIHRAACSPTGVQIANVAKLIKKVEATL